MFDKNAKWVTSKDCDSPIIIGKFYAPKETQSADINICGLGFFELFINGKKVSDDILVPAVTDYEWRNTRKSSSSKERDGMFRTLYLTYNILPYIKEGENDIEVWLGNGWYNQKEKKIEGEMRYDDVKLAYAITLTDKFGEKTNFYSDESLKWKKSPIVFNNIFYGEKWDYEILEDTIYPVEIANPPKSDFFSPQTCPADKEISVIKPNLIFSDGNRRIYDANINISGYAKVTGKGKIKITYSENMGDDNTLDYFSTECYSTIKEGGHLIQCDEYNTPKERTLKPKFTVKAFRYVEVMGDISDIEIIVAHSNIEKSSHFESDNEVLNWIYNAHIRTILNNMHHGTLSDCPHRERLAYLGDGQIISNAVMTTLNTESFYKKWIRDIYDCQNKLTGNVENTAPYGGGGGGPGGWGGAIVIVPYNHYKHFGDIEVLREGLPYMLKWYRFMLTRLEENLINKREEGCWFLGDWCTLEKITIPPELVNTYYFIVCMRKVMEIADILGEKIDEEDITKNINKCLLALKEKFGEMKIETDQGATCYLADLGLYDIEKIAQKYRENPVFDTGIFGTPLLMRLLFENGYEEIAFSMLANPDDVNFNFMKNRGATTYYEHWRGDNRFGNSHDQPMYSSVTENLFEHILGIGQKGIGYNEILIYPKFINGLDRASGFIDTVRGRISVSFDKKAGNLTVSVPHQNSTLILNGEKIPLNTGENNFKI